MFFLLRNKSHVSEVSAKRSRFGDSHFQCDIICITLFDWSVFIHRRCDSDGVERWKKKKKTAAAAAELKAFNRDLNHPFLHFRFNFLECIRTDSSVQYPFNVQCYQNVESSDCKDNLCLSSSSSTSINVFAQHPYTITTAMLSIAVNAHVSIEIKPFDFFCSSHSFSFQLLLSRLFQCSISSIVIVVVLSYLWFASFFQKHFMNPWRQLFRFFLQDVFFFHHAFCIKIIWNFLLQAMCSHKVSISSNGWMEKKTHKQQQHTSEDVEETVNKPECCLCPGAFCVWHVQME